MYVSSMRQLLPSQLFRKVIQQALAILGPILAALECLDDLSPDQPVDDPHFAVDSTRRVGTSLIQDRNHPIHQAPVSNADEFNSCRPNLPYSFRVFWCLAHKLVIWVMSFYSRMIATPFTPLYLSSIIKWIHLEKAYFDKFLEGSTFARSMQRCLPERL